MSTIPSKVASALRGDHSTAAHSTTDPSSLDAREKRLQETRRDDSKFPPALDGRLRVTPQSEIKYDPNQPMLAAEWDGKNEVTMRTRASPMVTDPHDAIIRTTSLSLCGTDVHVYLGEAPGRPMKKGDVMGHECMGVVESIGSAVKNIAVGDRVVVSAVLACGDCNYCKKQEFSFCESTNPSAALETTMGARNAGLMGIGHPNGGFSGCQAERVRVPFANINTLKVPDGVTDVQALLLSDILCTAWHGLELVKLCEGQTLAVWGGGPVGQLVAYLAKKVRKASRVVLIDSHEYRLAFASQWGVEGINRTKTSNVISCIQSLMPEGGVDACIDCAGFRFAQSTAHRMMRALSIESDTSEILTEMLTVTKPRGHISLIGEYFGPANGVPLGMIFQKDITVRGGPVFLQKYWHSLLDMIQNGTIDLAPFFSHRVRLEDLPSAYKTFSQRDEHVIKMFVETEFGRQRGSVQMGSFTPMRDRSASLQAASSEKVEPQDTGSGSDSLHGITLAVNLTPQERRAVDAVVEYMNISYNPAKASSSNIRHLIASHNRFIAPTTFPGVTTLEQYTDAHAKVMKCLPDLHFESFDVLFVKDGRVALRYSATGTHIGEPHGDIAPTRRQAHWTASALFLVDDTGRIVEFVKEWDKLHMWQQLGWPIQECYSNTK